MTKKMSIYIIYIIFQEYYHFYSGGGFRSGFVDIMKGPNAFLPIYKLPVAG